MNFHFRTLSLSFFCSLLFVLNSFSQTVLEKNFNQTSEFSNFCDISESELLNFRYFIRWGVFANSDWSDSIRVYEKGCSDTPSKMTYNIPQSNSVNPNRIVLYLTMDKLSDDEINVEVTRHDFVINSNRPAAISQHQFPLKRGSSPVTRRLRGSNYGVAANVDLTLGF